MMSALAGIDQALWDIKGKYLNIPVWQMLGGKCRDRIRMYAHITPNVENPTIQEVCSWAEKRVRDWFPLFKDTYVCPGSSY